MTDKSTRGRFTGRHMAAILVAFFAIVITVNVTMARFAMSTFGGKVVLVDATSNAKGEFRVLIEPDPAADDQPWPEGKYLRQGNRANGWVFLNRVTLGYELWRRLNGFPPAVADKPPDDGPDKPFRKKVK